MSDLACETAASMSRLIRSRAASCVEITRAVLGRIEALEPRLNAIVALDAERAIEAAHRADAALSRGDVLGALHGIPVTIKDIVAVSGLPTRRGSRLTNPAPSPEDSPAVARLRAAGAIILVKTTTTEQGWTAVSSGPLSGHTHNPWRHGLTAGGSSSGAAALAAARCGPIHLGTDGAGSARLPAHFCGVIGFKPTFGTVPYAPVPNNGFQSHIGPIARTIEDASVMLDVMSGPDSRDHTTLPLCPTPGQAGGVRGLRIAYSPDLGHARVDPGIASTVAAAAHVFEALGAAVEQVTPPWGVDGPELIRALWGPPLLQGLPTDSSDQQKMDPGLVACAAEAIGFTLAEWLAAQGRRHAYAASVNSWFEGSWDLLLTPAASVAAFPVGRQRPEHWPDHDWDWLAWAEFSYPFNLAHGPAISIPCGTTEDGLPVGLQLAGPRFADGLVLRAASAFLSAHTGPATTPSGAFRCSPTAARRRSAISRISRRDRP